MENTTKTTVRGTARGTTTTLRCCVSGVERPTHPSYPRQRAAALGMSVDQFCSSYISRGAVKLLRKGKTLAEVRAGLNSSCLDNVDAAVIAAAVNRNRKVKA